MPLSSLDVSALSFDMPPYRLSGVVVGALMNHPDDTAALGDAVNQPPYKAPPRAPVLAVKPRNTLALEGSTVWLPADAPEVWVSANLGIVIGRTACHVAEHDALRHVAGYVVVIDFSLPLPAAQPAHYRPAVRQRARDGFCPVGQHAVPAQQVPEPNELAVRVWLDGECVQLSSTAGRTRGVAKLLADVSEFMTLNTGDLLLLGAAPDAPRAHAGQQVAVQIDGLGMLQVQLQALPAAPTQEAA